MNVQYDANGPVERRETDKLSVNVNLPDYYNLL